MSKLHENSHMKTFNEQIREIRKKRKLTQKKVADLLCMEQSTYSKLERGEHAFTINHLEKLQEILQVKMEIKLHIEDGGKLQKIERDVDLGLLDYKDQTKRYRLLVELYITSKLNEFQQKYEYAIPFDEMDDMDLEYLAEDGITTKEQYDNYPYPLITTFREEDTVKAFAEMMNADTLLHDFFNFNVVQERSLLRYWIKYSETNKVKSPVLHVWSI